MRGKMLMGALTGTLFYAVAASASPVVTIPPPGSTAEGTVESNTDIFIFQERSGFVLPSPVAVDSTTAGSFAVPGDLTPGTIAPGTRVDSYYMFSNPESAPGSETYSGTFTFAHPI